MSLLNFWKKPEQTETKKVETGIAMNDTAPRGSIDKAYYPGFLVKPPFGWPKYKDIYTLRRVAATPQAAMAIQTIIDEVVAVPWNIVSKEGIKVEENSVTEARIMEVTQFFNNPNSSKESFEKILKVITRDILELDSGIIIKEFNKLGNMVELKSTDSAGFLKNPNQYGKYDEREDIIIEGFVDYEGSSEASAFLRMENTNRPGGMSIADAQRKAAYFQYGYLTSAKPVPFGKKEIVWLEKNPLPYDIYGRSPTETITDVLQTLIYSIQYNLDYFEENNVPKGFIKLAGASRQDLDDFSNRWNDLQLKKDTLSGRLKKVFHKVPITNSPNAEFIKVQFSSQELELISSQEWFSKLVWAAYGVTPSEVGFTENSNKATEINQSRVFKRKAILPILRLLEYHINKEIISEWEYDDIEFKFNTFDIEDEKEKWDLYKIQLETKTKTVNEIRLAEGLDEVEWGDGPQQDRFGVNPNLNPNFPEENTGDNEDENNTELDFRNSEKKNLTSNSPVTLGENETLSILKKVLATTEKEILNLLKQETKKDRLTQIKSAENILKKIEGLSISKKIEGIIKKAVENLFKKGWEKSEKQVQENLLINKSQIDFLQKYTFDNIKGMDDDLKNKLKQELKRAIIEGEGISKVTTRIKKVFDTTTQRAEKITRTELNRSENLGSLGAMKKSGKKMTKTWSSAHDNRTSALCKRLDGQTVPLDKKFKDKEGEWDAPPSHVNCRSSLLFNIVGD